MFTRGLASEILFEQPARKDFLSSLLHGLNAEEESRMLRKIALWIDDRLHVSKLFDSTAGHTVPASAGSWFYVFGSGTLLCFVLQIVTGICLAFVYVPSADEAYTTLEYLNYQQPLGWYLRALHFWGSNFMVSIMAIHMTQVFLFGAFKYPRELTWISGCVLAASHTRHGVHRTDHAFRPGRLLGAGYRRGDHGPDPAHRTQPRALTSRRPDHCR